MSLLTRPTAGTDALVLRTWSCGETSVIASLLTRDLGFVKVLAKAARRPRSRLRALVEPGRLVNVEFSVDPQRELQYLRGGSVIMDPLGDGATLERSAYLQGALELVDRCRPASGGPGAGDAAFFAVCEEFVRVLSSPTCSAAATLFFALEWRLLDRHGTAPQVAACACCGVPQTGPAGGARHFHPAEGGIVCGNCVGGGAASGARTMGAEALAVLQALATGDLKAAAALDLPGHLRREVGGALHRFLGYYLPGYRLPAALDLLRAGKERSE